MTTQEAYEMMRVYLTRLGARQAISDNDGCMYETVLGDQLHRCAIGCLLSPAGLSETIVVTEDIADQMSWSDSRIGTRMAVRDFEGTIIDLFSAEFRLEDLDGVDQQFLLAAQVLHDDYQNWKGRKFNVKKLDKLAEHYNLTVVSDEPQGAPREELVVA